MWAMLLSILIVCAHVVAASTCPEWTIQWPTYEITYNGTLKDDICTYSNVRFGSPPVQDLRFAVPEYPPAPGAARPDGHVSCIQVGEMACAYNILQSVSSNSCGIASLAQETEDCLFLDVYVPQSASPPNTSLPVVVWLYGGAYSFGSKVAFDPAKVPFYLGNGMLQTAKQKLNESLVFVTGNYRLGAFGWLAGSYVEEHAQPNAGLLDQRAILRFVHDHIQPDYKKVSLWGESAGGSSVMHHIAVPENTRHNTSTQLFNRAIVQSPGYQWLWDRDGVLNDTYSEFARLSGCSTGEMACLRNASIDKLTAANSFMFQESLLTGILPFGPSLDGELIPSLTPDTLAKGNGLELDTIAVTHVDLEVPYSNALDNTSFIPLIIRQNPQNQSAFESFLNTTFPGSKLADVRAAINTTYPAANYSDQIARTVEIIRDSGFTCNTRYLVDHYLEANISVYAMNYAIFSRYGTVTVNASVHGSDLLPEFSNAATNYGPFISCIANASSWTAWAGDYVVRTMVAPNMQEMFVKHAIYGDPNHGCSNETCTYQWNSSKVEACSDEHEGTCVWNLLKPQTDSIFPTTAWVWRNSSEVDLQTTGRRCDLWRDIAVNISRLAGTVRDFGGLNNLETTQKILGKGSF